MSISALGNATRSVGAQWFIPSESEWYKAAYYQPAAAGGDTDSYWDYPMKTNAQPYSSQPPGTAPDNTRVGNFFQDDGVPNGYDDGYAATDSPIFSSFPNYLTDVGAYSSAPSYYGTFDQGGNVAEWNDSLDGGTGRIWRGGEWFGDASAMAASLRLGSVPINGYGYLGFRVATVAVPEPSTFLLLTLAVLVTPIRLRHQRLAPTPGGSRLPPGYCELSKITRHSPASFR